MIKSTIYVIVFLMAMAVGPQALAQNSINYRDAEDQRRLQVADSIYQVYDARTADTKQALDEARTVLKQAQQAYNTAKQQHRLATKASNESKQAIRMEQKAQKARKKAEDQTSRARNAALVSDQN